MINQLRAAGTTMLGACHAEWIKVRTLRFNLAAAVGAVVLVALFAAVTALSIAASVANGYDLTASAGDLTAQAVSVGQLPVLMIAITMITGEYSHGAIRLSLRGTPLRGQLLLAKGVVMAGVAAAIGVVVAVTGMITAATILGDADTTTAADAIRTAVGVAGYLVLVSLLVIGIGTMTRSLIVSILLALLLMLIAPILTDLVSADWVERAVTYLPSTAGVIVMSPDGGDYGTGPAVGVLAAWAALAMIGGYIRLWLRDA